MADQHAARIAGLLADPGRVLTEPQTVERLSRDFYWYSPVLRKQLDGKVGELAVQPANVEEIRRVLAYCYAHDLAVTARGAGTGNYGQAVPLARGVVLDLAGMDRIEAIQPTGIAVCEPGVRLGQLETAARMVGWELRCYPSTLVKASLGGFLGGGSGGIGSVSHGGLRDFDTVRGLELVTMESEPRVVAAEGEAVHEILHAWGTNGIIVRIRLALTPAVEWSQCLIAFGSFAEAFDFSEGVANHTSWIKRLVSVFESPISSFFTPIRRYAPPEKALALIYIARAQAEALSQAALRLGGELCYLDSYRGVRTQPLLSDYSWNHTTLWALKADPAYTYLQCAFDPLMVRQQMQRLKQHFGSEILFHMEFIKNGAGVIVPGALPLVHYRSEERLGEMIELCRDLGVAVANPHVNNVEGGGRYRADNIQLLAKQRYDPKGLLNPGKMASFRPSAATRGERTA